MMKTKKLTLSLLMVSVFILFSFTNDSNIVPSDENEGDLLVGVWEPGHGKAKVKISKVGNKYFGKIVWLKEPKNELGEKKMDVNNTDEKMHGTPLLGYKILKDFEYVGDDVWENGTIYDPENGSLYSCTIKKKSKTKIEVRGYIGVSMIGRTDTWTKLQKGK